MRQGGVIAEERSRTEQRGRRWDRLEMNRGHVFWKYSFYLIADKTSAMA